MPWEWPVGGDLRVRASDPHDPAGVSGALLLLPIQLSVAARSQPSRDPTNLLFNVASTPGGLLRFAQERRLLSPLARLLVTGTLPGAIIRVQLLTSSRAFTFVAASVLFPLGLWLILGAQRLPRDRPRPTPAPTG